MKSIALSLALALAGLSPASLSAQGLPSGATSLNETYGNWVLACVAQEAATRCAITHSQQDPQSRQRILAIEVNRAADGSARGILVMPFGLKLAEGVALVAPDEAPMELAFSTCLPAGCILPLSLDAALVERLSKGGVAELRAVAADGGKGVTFSLPLDGFGPAFGRLADLSK